MEPRLSMNDSSSFTADPRVRTSGRPRSENSRLAVLDATRRLLGTMKVRELKIDAIAQEAGVGKATIYRWWANKNAVVIDTFIGLMLPATPVPQTASALDAVSRHLVLLVSQYRGELGQMVAEILAEGQSDPALREAFRERFFRQRRAAVREVVVRGVANGEFASDLDIDTALDMLYGAVYFRLLMGHKPLDTRFAKALGVAAASLLRVVEKR